MTAAAEEFDIASRVLGHLTTAIADHGLTEIHPQIDAKTLRYDVGDGKRFVTVAFGRIEAEATIALTDLIERRVAEAIAPLFEEQAA